VLLAYTAPRSRPRRAYSPRRGIAQVAGRGDELTGSTHTMIGVVQSAIIETPGLLDAPVGCLLSLADLYEHMAGTSRLDSARTLPITTR
jgi:hypothetical protein